MLVRANSWNYFSEECDRFRTGFGKLKYPADLVNLAIITIKQFVNSEDTDQPRDIVTSGDQDVRSLDGSEYKYQYE